MDVAKMRKKESEGNNQTTAETIEANSTPNLSAGKSNDKDKWQTDLKLQNGCKKWKNN